ncbi:hypothetical protein E3V55_01275 [Candidatus Marinimicrobia bacterium MT.SAG.3]|nr:hypothetical protein [Candidatus Neomarinimicrobiota bacterium]MCH8304084.1 hypothetical protein [Candidatus Neomarinimicrobiota bacterium]TFB12220.1 hypothetical protein E3V55_01275 [Candidatus Marinimicrobia bacterium MT.SAG.3]TFB12649.1 hypothetical protein E3V33_04965 [Candidatus Marinimicrobia bacterium MT.SAG.4]
MAKDRSFATKTAKTDGGNDMCPVCGDTYTNIRHISTAKSDKTDAWKANRKMVKVCSCNQKEIYG